MRYFSIRLRLVAATSLLVLATVGGVVGTLIVVTTNQIKVNKAAEARRSADSLALAFMNELSDENWSQLRVATEQQMLGNPDMVYMLVSDVRRNNRIIAATPEDAIDTIIPDLVPASVTREALGRPRIMPPRTQEAWLLRDVALGGVQHAAAGTRVVEVASDIRTPAGMKVGVMRIGLSLTAVSRAVTRAVRLALFIGLISLGLGLLGSLALADRIVRPIRRLQQSATKIADGDLSHRAAISSNDEIGMLARSFNEMSQDLEQSFDQLRSTLQTFERFVPQQFLRVIAPEGIEKIEIGTAQIRHATILFSDIRGYTRMSEHITPLETFRFLNDYLGRMGDVISRGGGFIDKYIGDAIMALFDAEHTDGVLETALAIRRELAAFNHDRRQLNLEPIEIGIGIHDGEVVMGTIGFVSKIESTVIGETVNLASRIEALTKHYDCRILISQTVVDRLREPQRFLLRLVDQSVMIRGIDRPMALYTAES
ncbi:MAG: adenylate/guanylate cyclase domain-containing protein [Cyanobium sp.]